MSLDGTVYVVRLVKVHADEVSPGSNGKLRWPRLGNDSPATIHGALILHDATRPTAHSETSKTLGLLYLLFPRQSLWLKLTRPLFW